MKIELIGMKQLESNLTKFPENTIGIIRQWGDSPEHIGKVVIRFGNVVHTLTNLLRQVEKESWLIRDYSYGIYNIEVLPKGSELKITV